MLHAGILPPARGLGGRAAQPRVGGGGRGPRLPRSVRRTRRQRDRPATAPVPVVRLAAPVCSYVCHHRQPAGGAERLAGGPVTVVDRDGSPAAEREIAIWNPPLLDELLGGAPAPSARPPRCSQGWFHEVSVRSCSPRAEPGASWCTAMPGKDWNATTRGKRGGWPPMGRLHAGGSAADRAGAGRWGAVGRGRDQRAGAGHRHRPPRLCRLGWVPRVDRVAAPAVGPAGRRRAGLGIYVAAEDALDQYFARHPDQLLGRPVEAVVCNPQNPSVQAVHLLCAAAERPLVEGDAEHFGEAGMALAPSCPSWCAPPKGSPTEGQAIPAQRFRCAPPVRPWRSSRARRARC